MNRGSDRQKVFLGKSDYQAFLKTVSEAYDLWGIEVAREFGVKSYGTVGWACHGISLKCDVNSKYRRQIENLKTAICQPNRLLPTSIILVC